MTFPEIETHPALSLVGWYTFGAAPETWHSRIQLHLKNGFNCDPPIMLLYHAEQVKDSADSGSMPYSVFESVILNTEDREKMELDNSEPSQTVRFRHIESSVETAADEAIALADIAQGATNAALTEGSAASIDPTIAGVQKSDSFSDKTSKTSTGKGKAKAEDAEEAAQNNFLTAQDEESKLGILHLMTLLLI
jgi:hypothetical protein